MGPEIKGKFRDRKPRDESLRSTGIDHAGLGTQAFVDPSTPPSRPEST